MTEDQIIAEVIAGVVAAVPGAGPWVGGAAVIGFLFGRGKMPGWAKAVLAKLAMKKARFK